MEIQNQEIIKKLEEKTDCEITKTFIYELFKIEVEGKNYKKLYESEVNKALASLEDK